MCSSQVVTPTKFPFSSVIVCEVCDGLKWQECYHLPGPCFRSGNGSTLMSKLSSYISFRSLLFSFYSSFLSSFTCRCINKAVVKCDYSLRHICQQIFSTEWICVKICIDFFLTKFVNASQFQLISDTYSRHLSGRSTYVHICLSCLLGYHRYQFYLC